MPLSENEVILKIADKIAAYEKPSREDAFVREIKMHYRHWTRKTVDDDIIRKAISDKYKKIYPSTKSRILEIAKSWLRKSAFVPEQGEKPDKEGYYWRTVMGRKMRFQKGQEMEGEIKDRKTHLDWQETGDDSDDKVRVKNQEAYRKAVRPVSRREFDRQDAESKERRKKLRRLPGQILDMSLIEISGKEIDDINAIMNDPTKMPDKSTRGEIDDDEDGASSYDDEEDDEEDYSETSYNADTIRRILNFGTKYKEMVHEGQISFEQVEDICEVLAETNPDFREVYEQNMSVVKEFNDLNKEGLKHAKHLYRGTSKGELDAYLKYSSEEHGEESAYPYVSTSIDPEVAMGDFDQGVILIFDAEKHKKKQMLQYDFRGITEQDYDTKNAPYSFGFWEEQEMRLDWSAGYRNNGLQAIVFTDGDISDKKAEQLKKRYEKIVPVHFGVYDIPE